METRKQHLVDLNETITQFVDVCKNISNPETMVNEGWTVLDVLGHVTFWHESFARNTKDIVNGIKPTPLKGKFVELDQQRVNEMRGYTRDEIIEKLKTAHQVIQQNILDPKLIMIPYRKGSRDYSPEEHLDIVNKHVGEHLKSLQK